VVDEDAEARAALVAELRRRYGADYGVLDAASTDQALERFRQVRTAGALVALVLVDVRTGGEAGDAVAFLSHLRTLDPLTKRLLLATPMDKGDSAIVQRAAALGRVDHYLYKPRARRDEQFHAVLTDFLRSWGRDDPDRFTLVRIVGEQWERRSHELRDLMDRLNIPYRFLTHDTAEGRALAAGSDRLPIAVLLDGTVLVDPGREEIAEQYGVRVPGEVVDLAIVGAGPAGLAAAVSATSEGLDTVIVEREAMGGQAGTSSRIRNYLGFPQGVLGADLAARAMDQAWTFGTRYVLLQDVTRLAVQDGLHRLELSGGETIRARSVLLAGGAHYRRLDVPELEDLVGAGVFYGAAGSEAGAMAGADVYVAGGGNAAGQAAVHLARHAKRVTLLVRGAGLAASMSEYLVDEIGLTDNIELRFHTEVMGGGGTGRLEWLRLRDRRTGGTEEVATPGLFVLNGAVPHTRWLPPEVRLDPQGFVLTGTDLLRATGPRPPLQMETSMPGVFAAGDIRARSMKRVATAVGEGATVVAEIHQHLSRVRALG
jgi:thioredoxin reductase (NADPH)